MKRLQSQQLEDDAPSDELHQRTIEFKCDLQTALEALCEAPPTAEEMEEETDAKELLNPPAADEADDASCEVADAAELVTEPTPPPMIPPFVADAVLDDEAPEDEAAASSNKKVGVKASNEEISVHRIALKQYRLTWASIPGAQFWVSALEPAAERH